MFRVRKKVFAYFLNDHHGDDTVAITCKVMPAENTALASAQPKRYYLPAYIGPRGWVALRLDLAKIDWSEIRDLLLGGYLLNAPKRLADQIKPRLAQGSVCQLWRKQTRLRWRRVGDCF